MLSFHKSWTNINKTRSLSFLFMINRFILINTILFNNNIMKKYWSFWYNWFLNNIYIFYVFGTVHNCSARKHKKIRSSKSWLKLNETSSFDFQFIGKRFGYIISTLHNNNIKKKYWSSTLKSLSNTRKRFPTSTAHNFLPSRH